MLPEPNKLVVALLEGTSHHTGDAVGWHREGWAFMVRWEDAPAGHTVADGWARDRYEKALKQIDADYADVVRWVYVEDLPAISTEVR